MSSLIIQTDSRERQNAHILQAFDMAGIKHFTSKLPVGDYMNLKKPLSVIERKGSLSEVYGNLTAEHNRFISELKRARDIEIHVLILVESDTARRLEDVIKWRNPRARSNPRAFNGDRLYKIMATVAERYNTHWLFVPKLAAGNEIICCLQ